MTRCIIQSAPTERSFMTDKNWQTPWHREWKHGKVQPLDTPLVAWGRRISSRWFVWGAVVIAGVFAIQLGRAI